MNKAPLSKLIADIERKSLQIVRDIHHSADEPKDTWTPRRRKIIYDAQQSSADAPFYLKAAATFATQAIKGEQDKSAPRTLGIVIGVPMISRDEWLKLGETVEEDTERERRAIEAVEVKK